jgi:hypothetical protein
MAWWASELGNVPGSNGHFDPIANRQLQFQKFSGQDGQPNWQFGFSAGGRVTKEPLAVPKDGLCANGIGALL